MKVFKVFANFDKEEAWLTRKASQWHILSKVGLLYSFAPVAPGRATVRVDCRSSMSAEDFEDYKSLFADAGWKHLAGSRGSGLQYFASLSGDANADIFSEEQSKAQRYRRSICNALILLPIFIVVLMLGYLGSISFDTLFSPRDWYLTPGLWEMHGWEFTRAFLFETPFVAFRGAGPFLLVLACVVLATQVAYQSLLYRKTLARAKTMP